jgi:hypothetical protein
MFEHEIEVGAAIGPAVVVAVVLEGLPVSQSLVAFGVLVMICLVLRVLHHRFASLP